MSVSQIDDNPPHGRAPETLKVGLLGCGVVGSAVARALLEDGQALQRAAGARLELAGVAVAHPRKARVVDLPADILTTDALAVAIDPAIDIVIEVIGGTDPALSAIRAALGDNKIVVTANKELLADRGSDLLDDPYADVYFEASVCGAVPVVRALKESCAGDRIEGFEGIFNGTCNFVLAEMTESGCSLEYALGKARELGYAEADPSADIEAFDPAAKVAILARLAFGVPVTIDDVKREGISGIDTLVNARAGSEGTVLKLIGRARRAVDGVELSVRPEWIPLDHPLATIDGAHNAVFLDTQKGGRLLLQGAGAGGNPTAAAILGDVVAASRRLIRARRPIPCVA